MLHETPSRPQHLFPFHIRNETTSEHYREEGGAEDEGERSPRWMLPKQKSQQANERPGSHFHSRPVL